MGMFSGLSKVQIKGYGDTQYFEPNKYIVEIMELKQITSRKGITMIVGNAKVLAKMNPSVEGPQTGEIGTWTIKITGVEPEIWKSNWIEFLCAVYGGCDPDEYDDDQWEDASEQALEHGSLEGEVLRLETFMNEKQTYTVHKWYPEPTEKQWNDYAETIEE